MDVAAFEEVGETTVIPDLGVTVFMATINQQDTETGGGRLLNQTLTLPFDLPIECFPTVKSILEKDPTMIGSMQIILAGHVADNTLKAYAPVIKKLHSFCVQQEYSFPFCTEMAIIDFLAHALKSKEPYSFFGKVSAALKYLGIMVGTDIATTFVISANNSIKRQLAKNKPPVKKAP